MDTIPHEKRLEIARYYLRGSTYAAIEDKSGVSHGTVVNIIKELVAGHLVVPGVMADEVHDLHQLSIDLAKNGIEPSKALLGIALFEKFMELEIEPSQVGHWAELVKIFLPENFPAKDFFEAALKLHQLEQAEGKAFDVLADEYTSMKQKYDSLKPEVDSLHQQKEGLIQNIKSLASEFNKLENQNKAINASVELESQKLGKINAATVAAQEKLAQTEKHVETLETKKTKLATEVNAKEKLLISLQALDFPEEDLMLLKNTLKSMAKKDGISPEQVKDQFFSALTRFGDLSGIEKATQEATKTLQDTLKQKSLLGGEIEELENRKAILHGEINESGAAGAEQIRAASREAVSAIQQDVESIRVEVHRMLEDTLVTGVAVGEMRAVQKSSDEAGKELEGVVSEVERRLGERRW